jgi:SAM-dependent methyltransferase
MARYLFDHGWELEWHRLRLLESVFDPGTVRHLEAVGTGPGWRCLEVGAGAGSMVRWLCSRVGPAGQVVATDLDTGFLASLEEPNLRVMRHDVVADDLDEGDFDLIHARLVLEHLPARELALKRLVAALAPGGVLMLEEFDWSSLCCPPGPAAELFNRVMVATQDFMESTGYTSTWGRSLAAVFQSQGLVDVAAEGRIIVGVVGAPATEWWRLTLERMREGILARGGASRRDLEAVLVLLDTDDFSFCYPALIAACGRRPPPAGG